MGTKKKRIVSTGAKVVYGSSTGQAPNHLSKIKITTYVQKITWLSLLYDVWVVANRLTTGKKYNFKTATNKATTPPILEGTERKIA